jgi:hypothetical protein
VGEVDVDGMLSRIPSRLLTEWVAYYGLEPFGQERENMHAGLVASAVYNVNRDPKKRRKAFSPADFMLEFDSAGAPKAEKSPQEIYGMFRTWAQLHRDKRQ